MTFIADELGGQLPAFRRVFEWFEGYAQATRVFLRQHGHSRKPFTGHLGAGCMSSHQVELIHWSTCIAVNLDVGHKNTSVKRTPAKPPHAEFLKFVSLAIPRNNTSSRMTDRAIMHLAQRD